MYLLPIFESLRHSTKSFLFLLLLIPLSLFSESFSYSSYFGVEYLPVKEKDNHSYREKAIVEVGYQKELSSSLNTELILSYNEKSLKKAVELKGLSLEYSDDHNRLSVAIFQQEFGLHSQINNCLVIHPDYKKAALFEYDLTGVKYERQLSKINLWADMGGNKFNTFSLKSGISYNKDSFYSSVYFHTCGRNQTYNDNEKSAGVDVSYESNFFAFKSSKIWRTFSEHKLDDELISFDEFILSKGCFSLGGNFKTTWIPDSPKHDSIYQLLVQYQYKPFNFLLIYADYCYRKSFVAENSQKISFLSECSLFEVFRLGIVFAHNKMKSYWDYYEVGMQISAVYCNN